MKITMMTDKELMKRLPKELAVGVEGADYVVPKAGSIREMVTMGWALKTQAPAKLTPLETETLEGVVEGLEFVTLSLAQVDAPSTSPKLKKPRLGAVRGSTTIKGILKMIATSDTEDAEDAALLLAELFSGDLDRLNELTPRAVWQTVWMFERQLEQRPELKEKMKRLVPESMTGQLLKVNGELGKALHVTQRKAGETQVDAAAAKTFLRRRLSRYASAVLASASDDDMKSVQRVMEALSPIKQLREDIAKRNIRKAGYTVVEEEEAEVDETEVDETEVDETETEVDETEPPPELEEPAGNID